MFAELHTDRDDGTPPRPIPVVVGASVDPLAGFVVVEPADLGDPERVDALVARSGEGSHLLVTASAPTDLEAAVHACALASDRGVDGSMVSVELVVPHPIPAGLLDAFVAATHGRVGRSIALVGAADLPPAVRIGWQVGTLVRLLPQGLSTVRGVDPVVLQRVHEVLRRTEETR